MSTSHYRKLENMYRGAPINRLYEPEIRISEGASEISIPVKDMFFHAAGALHGSVYFKLLDDASFFAVNSLVEDVFVLTVSFTTYITRPVTSGRLTSRGKAVHSGKNLFLAEAVITDQNGKEVGRGSGSFMKGKTLLAPEIGYRE